MKKIAIRFPDNDFYKTVFPFMEHIVAGLTFNPTKEQVVELFNNSAYAFYMAYQNQFTYGDPVHNQYLKDSYLKIDVDRVYFDSEVDEFLKECGGWDNGEFFVHEFQVRMATGTGYTYNL